MLFQNIFLIYLNYLDLCARSAKPSINISCIGIILSFERSEPLDITAGYIFNSLLANDSQAENLSSS